MNRAILTAWVAFCLDPSVGKKPDGEPVAKLRSETLRAVCDEKDVEFNEKDPMSSVLHCAKVMNAEVPEGDIDRQIAMLYQLAFGGSDNASGAGKPTTEEEIRSMRETDMSILERLELAEQEISNLKRSKTEHGASIYDHGGKIETIERSLADLSVKVDGKADKQPM